MIAPRKALVTYARNTSWLLAGRVARMAMAVGAGIVVARYLGPERFGILNYALSFVGLFSFLTTLGQETIMVRELVNRPHDRDVLLGTSFGMRALGTIIFLVSVGAISQWAVPPETRLVVLVVALAAVWHPFLALTPYLFSRVRAGGVAFAECVSVAGSSAFKIAMVLVGASLLWFAWGAVIEAALMALALVVVYRRIGGRLSGWSFRRSLAGLLLIDAWPLIVSGLLSVVYMRIDQIMLMYMSGEGAVGVYAAAVRLSESAYFIPAVIVSSLSPAVINARRQSRMIFERRMGQIFGLLFAASLAMAIPMSLWADSLVTLAFGEAYQEAGVALAILSFAGVFYFLGAAVNQWLIIEHLQMWSLYRTALGMVVNVGLNFYLIPRYGVEGAAISTLMAYAVAAYLALVPVPVLHRLLAVQTRSLFFWWSK